VEEECDSPKMKKIMKINVENVSEGDILSDQSSELFDSQKRKRNKKGGFIELRDLAESDFLDLIGSKNQDKRFYSWLNFKPLFEDEMMEDHEDYIKATVEKDICKHPQCPWKEKGHTFDAAEMDLLCDKHRQIQQKHDQEV
jgi:hypothetical protein